MNTNQVAENDTQELAGIARARAAFYAFLGLHFTTLPDLQFVERLRNGEFRSVLANLQNDALVGEDIHAGAALMSAYLDRMRTIAPDHLVKDLGVDRTRLYRGVAQGYGPPPPNEMVWSKDANDFSVLQIISIAYREMGLEPSPEVKERLDYISVEMDFMRELALREADAWEAGDREIAKTLVTTEQSFLNKHLGSWVPDFIERALEFAQTDFYKGHLYMLRGFIQDEKQELAVEAG